MELLHDWLFSPSIPTFSDSDWFFSFLFVIKYKNIKGVRVWTHSRKALQCHDPTRPYATLQCVEVTQGHWCPAAKSNIRLPGRAIYPRHLKLWPPSPPTDWTGRGRVCGSSVMHKRCTLLWSTQRVQANGHQSASEGKEKGQKVRIQQLCLMQTDRWGMKGSNRDEEKLWKTSWRPLWELLHCDLPKGSKSFTVF